MTADHPASFEGEERKARQRAILRDLPGTGYAAGIRYELSRDTFFQPHGEEKPVVSKEEATPVIR